MNCVFKPWIEPFYPPMNQDALKQLIESALQEDIGEGDHSTLACIPEIGRAHV